MWLTKLVTSNLATVEHPEPVALVDLHSEDRNETVVMAGRGVLMPMQRRVGLEQRVYEIRAVLLDSVESSGDPRLEPRDGDEHSTLAVRCGNAKVSSSKLDFPVIILTPVIHVNVNRYSIAGHEATVGDCLVSCPVVAEVVIEPAPLDDRREALFLALAQQPGAHDGAESEEAKDPHGWK